MNLFFAATEPGGILLDLEKTSTVPTGVSYVVGAVCLVVLVVVIWAAFIRRPKDERARHYRYGSSERSTSGQRNGEAKSAGSGGRRRRRRRPRNPTLAETGGLPPRRDEAPAGDPP